MENATIKSLVISNSPHISPHLLVLQFFLDTVFAVHLGFGPLILNINKFGILSGINLSPVKTTFNLNPCCFSPATPQSVVRTPSLPQPFVENYV